MNEALTRKAASPSPDTRRSAVSAVPPAVTPAAVTTPLWIGLYLPQLPLETVLRGSPSPEAWAVAEADRILLADRKAEARGVRAGMLNTAALALAPQLRIRARDPLLADQVAINYRKAGITSRQAAMLDFAMKVALESHLVCDADHATLHAHGFSDEDAWDIAAIAAFFAMSNRLASATGMMPNEEFYLMGRLPRT